MQKPHNPLPQALRAARIAKGLSQRALSERVGLPQSHLSRIENGAVDVQLSNLVEIARALDLELTLVPRQLLPALGALQRDVASTSATNATKLDDRLARVEAKARRVLPTLEDHERGVISQLLNIIGTSHAVALDPYSSFQLDQALKEIEKLLDFIGRKSKDSTRQPRFERLKQLVDSHQGWRNRLMHQAEHRFLDQIPAYRLPDDGG